MNATIYSAAGDVSLPFLECIGQQWALPELTGKTLIKMASVLSLTGKVLLAKPLVPIFYCVYCV